MLVPGAALSPMGQDHRLLGGNIRHNLAGLGLPDNSAERDPDNQVLPAFAGTAAGAAGLAVLGLEFISETEIHQGIHAAVRHKNHISAPAAVAAVRAAGRHIFFPAEGHGAVAAVAGLDFNFCTVYKHNVRLSPPKGVS